MAHPYDLYLLFVGVDMFQYPVVIVIAFKIDLITMIIAFAVVKSFNKNNMVIIH